MAPDGRPLRVALLVYRGNPHSGGQGVYTRYLSRHLVELGHQVTVFAGQPWPVLDEEVDFVPVPSLDLYREPDPFRVPWPHEVRSWVDAMEFGLMSTAGFPEPLTFSLRVRTALAGRRADFDVIHDNQCLGRGLLDLLDEGWPMLATVHHPITVDRALDLSHATSFRRKLALRRWYGFLGMQLRVARRMPRVLTVSASSAGDIVGQMGLCPERLVVVPIGVDHLRFHPLPRVARVPGRIMTTASADVPLKGLVPLLEGLAKLRTEHDADLVVIGKPRPDSHVAATIERLGLAGAVRFVPGVTDDELVELYAAGGGGGRAVAVRRLLPSGGGGHGLRRASRGHDGRRPSGGGRSRRGDGTPRGPRGSGPARRRPRPVARGARAQSPAGGRGAAAGPRAVHLACLRGRHARAVPLGARPPPARRTPGRLMLTVRSDRLGLRAADRVLDLGCGGGRHAFEAMRRGAAVVALDADAAEIKDVAALVAALEAEECAVRTAGGSGSTVVGDALSLPFPDGVFDRVIAAEVLEHIPTDVPAVAELARVLRPGGTLAVTVPRWYPELVCWALSDDYHQNPGGHVRIYRQGVLVRRLSAAGLQVYGCHFAHALHTPYWWLRCAVGVRDDGHRLVRAAHRLLVWDITAASPVTRVPERLLNPILGKSLVLYARKPHGAGVSCRACGTEAG